jgi:hypothetical protein
MLVVPSREHARLVSSMGTASKRTTGIYYTSYAQSYVKAWKPRITIARMEVTSLEAK